jgi:hypothetical protein
MAQTLPLTQALTYRNDVRSMSASLSALRANEKRQDCVRYANCILSG